MVAKLLNMFAELGWAIAPASLARSMGSAHTALASFEVAGATWRIRIGERVTHLERRAHGTPSGRVSSGHWVSIGTLDTPRRLAAWRELAEALTSEALAFESMPIGEALTRLGSQHTRRTAADGGEFGGTSHGRGRVGKSNPTRLGAFGFAPASGVEIARGDVLIDANPECTTTAHYQRLAAAGCFRTVDSKIRSARNLRRNASRLARRKAKGVRN